MGVDANGAPLRTVGLTCADHAACAIFDVGRSKCWGYNNYAQLVIENTAVNTAVGDEGGFAPDLESNEAALQALVEGIEAAGSGRREQRSTLDQRVAT